MPTSLLNTLKALAVLVVAVAGAVNAQPITLNEAQKHLMAASKLYERLEYEKALEEVPRAKSGASGPADDAAIGRYEGVILFDLGRRTEALVSFKQALLIEPDAHLAVRVSPKITEAYEATRVQAKTELAAVEAKNRAAEEVAKARAEAARVAAVQREAKSRAEADETRKRAEEAKVEQLSDSKAREVEAAAAETKLAEAQLKLKEQTRVWPKSFGRPRPRQITERR